MTFDHLLLARRDTREVARFAGYLLGIQQGQVRNVRIEHEADGSCCDREAWPKTMRAIQEAVRPPTDTCTVDFPYGDMANELRAWLG